MISIVRRWSGEMALSWIGISNRWGDNAMGLNQKLCKSRGKRRKEEEMSYC
jgi:hypothetical protein